jgi:thiosulfate dehydrogenase [quinone] large subunit
MNGTLTLRERVVRVALGVLLGFIAYNVGLGSSGTEPKMVAWGALVLAIVALATAAAGTAGPLTRLYLDKDWSVGYLAARLFVGWEFLYAGWDKATTHWYSGAGGVEVKGFLGGAIAQSHASAKVPFPNVSNWFAWTANHVFLSHSHMISYLVVTGELCIGIGLIFGVFLRLAALFGVFMNALFLFSGSLSAGLNPEMVILGMAVLLGVAPGLYAVSLDGSVFSLLRFGKRRLGKRKLRVAPAAAPAPAPASPPAGGVPAV